MIGHNLVTYNNIRWKRHQQALIPFELPHVPIELSSKQARQVVCREKAALIRWHEDFDRLSASEWWFVIKDNQPGMGELSASTRSKVRRGLRHFQVFRCSAREVLEQGYAVYKAAYTRYDTFEPRLDAASFGEAIQNMPGNVHFWGVFEPKSKRMVAFSENIQDQGACFYSSMWFTPGSLQKYAAYALIYAMNVHYLLDLQYQYVTDGARSISHKTNIQDFLQDKFGFRKAYARLKLAYHPGIGPFVRCLYPLGRLFRNRRGKIASRLAVLLQQERIHRDCQGRFG